MTQEEKARAYDEALEKGRIFRDHLLETGDKGIAGEIEYIFPALSQSEDEQIRKALIEMVHDTTGDELWVDYNVHKEEALAWLEKQGKPTTIDIDKMVLKYSQTRETCTNGLPVNCQIRAYRQGLTDAISTLNLEKQGKKTANNCMA